MGIIANGPKLAGQMPRNTGHFYYSGDNEEGMARRDDLAEMLAEELLE